MTSQKPFHVSCNVAMKCGSELQVVLPGRGERGEGCGETMNLYCFDCGNYFFGKHSCMSRYCPDCYRKWAFREGLHEEKKILFNRRARKIIHCVVSIKENVSNIFSRRPSIYAILTKHGIEGGMVVPHHKRHGVLDGTVHYHCIGYLRGRYVPGDSSFKYIFKVISFLRGSNAVLDVASYLLGHCALAKGYQSITYFGKRLSPPGPDPVFYSRCVCPSCGSRCNTVVPLMDYTGGYSRGVEVGLPLVFGPH